MIKEALWDGMALVIIGLRWSRTTFGANDMMSKHTQCGRQTSFIKKNLELDKEKDKCFS